MADVLARMIVEEVRDILGGICGVFARDNTRATTVRRQPRNSSSCSPDCGSNPPASSGWTVGADTDANSLFSRGVSDHIGGRRLGRPSGHFGWSLTPRDCCWRPLRQWRHQAGGTERRPTTTACNLRRRLAVVPRRSPRASRCSSTRTRSSTRDQSRGNTSRGGGVPPRVPPLEGAD